MLILSSPLLVGIFYNELNEIKILNKIVNYEKILLINFLNYEGKEKFLSNKTMK